MASSWTVGSLGAKLANAVRRYPLPTTLVAMPPHAFVSLQLMGKMVALFALALLLNPVVDALSVPARSQAPQSVRGASWPTGLSAGAILLPPATPQSPRWKVWVAEQTRLSGRTMRIKTAPLHDVCQALSIDQRPPDGTEQCGVENEEPFVDLVLDNGQSASESTLCITVQVNEWVQEACTKASAHSQITIAVVITQTSSSTASTTDLFTHLQRTSGLNSLKAAKYAPQAEAMLVLICFGIHAVNDFATKLACHMI